MQLQSYVMIDGAKSNVDQIDQSSDSFLVMNDHQVDIIFSIRMTRLNYHDIKKAHFLPIRGSHFFSDNYTNHLIPI